MGRKAGARALGKIVSPPPTLARKLGITPETRVHMSGVVDDDALRAALENAADVRVPPAKADLAIVRADHSTPLLHWLQARAPGKPIPPIWIVYIKGRDSPFGESAVRHMMRSLGYIDTKIASVSDRLTALRFIKRREPPQAAQASRRRGAD
ncbi:MAG TPA: hypothetical protein VKG44_08095 [Candidatus Baltobacteraceae bacterium]|nr:hypothetical protein [Candidatus Baltobacteraceae bacterium]